MMFQFNFVITRLISIKHLLLLGMVLILSYQSKAQLIPSGSVFVSKKLDIPICITSTIWTGLNYYAQMNSPQRPKTYLNARVPGLDNFYNAKYNKSIAHLSDLTGILTCAAGAATILLQPKNDWMKKGIIMGESLWWTVNITQTVKMLTNRSRPYTEALGFIPTKKDDYYSFFSGHSAAVASVITSAFLLRDRGNTLVSSRGQKTLLATCLLLGTATALMRIAAGKHYPSDVLCGITTGMGIAYLNYKIHEK